LAGLGTAEGGEQLIEGFAIGGGEGLVVGLADVVPEAEVEAEAGEGDVVGGDVEYRISPIGMPGDSRRGEEKGRFRQARSLPHGLEEEGVGGGGFVERLVEAPGGGNAAGEDERLMRRVVEGEGDAEVVGEFEELGLVGRERLLFGALGAAGEAEDLGAVVVGRGG
jgi:hypothetical protein